MTTVRRSRSPSRTGIGVAAGEPVRVRLINTDPTPHRISVEGTSVTVTAVDGTDLLGPTPIGGQVLRIPAGGRYDVTFQMPDAPGAFAMEGAPDTGLRLSAMGGVAPVAFVDGPDLDLLSYGTPAPVPGITDAEVTREATLALDRQFRFLRGIPTLAQTINGEVHPFVPVRVRTPSVLPTTGMPSNVCTGTTRSTPCAGEDGSTTSIPNSPRRTASDDTWCAWYQYVPASEATNR